MPLTAKQAIQEAAAVFFDFDGVIIDTEWPIYLTWARLFEREGQQLDAELYVKCIGSDFDTWSPEKYLEELTGKSYDWLVENAARQEEIERAVALLPAMPGAEKLIRALRDAKSAVVSSSSHSWVDGWVEKLSLTECFDTIVCRGDAPRIKPAPDLYLEAAKRLEVNPTECLVIEDSMNGMIAAHDAGMKVIAVPNRLTRVLDFSAATWTANTLEELI